MQIVWKNLVDGIKNFCRHNGFDEVVLGLSGGLDSAMVAVAAKEAMGAENVHAIMMKTKYTSDLSLEIASEIAKINGLDYKIDDIQHLIDENVAHLENLWQEKPKNIVIENLQARERGKLLMACRSWQWDIARFMAILAAAWRRLPIYTNRRFLRWQNGATL